MIARDLLKELTEWRHSKWRKPLVLRGARQVGKTTVVNEFGKTFANYLYVNLEDSVKRKLMELDVPLNEKIDLLFNNSGSSKHNGDTLIFIDEIQNSPISMALLRYFYEDRPDIHVIAAGSLLENVVDVNVSFPVGRVQFMAVRPCSFAEFLIALGKENLRKVLSNPSLTQVYHEELLHLFNVYAVVGGMPEAVSRYAATHDINSMDDVYESLLQTYRDDVEKYVRGRKLTEVVRHILTYGWNYAGEIITLGHFAGSQYGAKEMGEAFALLSKAMLLELAYPSTATDVPATPEMRRRPKLIWLDTGLVNYEAGVRREMIQATDVMDVWRGRIAEHIVAQELLTLNSKVGQRRSFWTTGKGGDSAEVDFTIAFDSKLFPIEVKAGTNSHLRSLHSFLSRSHTNIGIRVWSGPFSIEEQRTTTSSGKPFKLINLPFYLIGQLENILKSMR